MLPPKLRRGSYRHRSADRGRPAQAASAYACSALICGWCLEPLSYCMQSGVPAYSCIGCQPFKGYGENGHFMMGLKAFPRTPQSDDGVVKRERTRPAKGCVEGAGSMRTCAFLLDIELSDARDVRWVPAWPLMHANTVTRTAMRHRLRQTRFLPKALVYESRRRSGLVIHHDNPDWGQRRSDRP